MGRKILIGSTVVCVLSLVAFFALGTQLERLINRVESVPLPEVSERAQRLHDASLVIDLHADSLLFGRNLLERSDVGHVDLPRLQDGGVGLQFFTAATVAPFSGDIHHTDANSFDLLTLAGYAQFSPFATQGALGRALWQAERLHYFAEEAGEQLSIIRTRQDLDTFLLRRMIGMRKDTPPIGAILGIEGAHALEGDLANFDVLYDAGYRMMGLSHFFDNSFSGSAHGIEKKGLTDKGRQLIQMMESRGMVIDLAHSSPTAIDEILDMVTAPTVVSHGGVKGTCDNMRNISDAHIHRIAAGGGVVGIGYWEMAVCGITPQHAVAAMQHVMSLVGEDHVALGSDYDGGTTTGFDTSQLRVLTQAMFDAGVSETAIRKILGANVLRVLRQVLPIASDRASTP